MKDGGNDVGKTAQDDIAVPPGKLILVVDDEVDIIDMFSMLLQLNGFRTIAASNARQALVLLESEHPDVIVSDCMMPGMDGVAFCAAVRAMPAHEHTPFVLMSGAPQRHSLVTPNYDVFVRKPFPFEFLLDLLERLKSPADGSGTL